MVRYTASMSLSGDDVFARMNTAHLGAKAKRFTSVSLLKTLKTDQGWEFKEIPKNISCLRSS